MPKDNYQVLLDFCIEHINQIIKKPKELLIKEAKMIRLNKIEYVTPRTIVYLSKKPGETIKEKLSNSRTLLADKKRFTTNIKENQCTLYLLKKLEKIASDRIKNGVENNLYHINDEKIKKTLDKIINLRTNLKKYSISEAVEKTTSIANNALLSHKNYSVIWKSINYLKDFNLLKRIENIKYRFICLFQLSILSMFSKYSHIIYNDVFI